MQKGMKESERRRREKVRIGDEIVHMPKRLLEDATKAMLEVRRCHSNGVRKSHSIDSNS